MKSKTRIWTDIEKVQIAKDYVKNGSDGQLYQQWFNSKARTRRQTQVENYEMACLISGMEKEQNRHKSVDN